MPQALKNCPIWAHWFSHKPQTMGLMIVNVASFYVDNQQCKIFKELDAGISFQFIFWFEYQLTWFSQFGTVKCFTKMRSNYCKGSSYRNVHKRLNNFLLQNISFKLSCCSITKIPKFRLNFDRTVVSYNNWVNSIINSNFVAN